jgi:hypothetical protein
MVIRKQSDTMKSHVLALPGIDVETAAPRLTAAAGLYTQRGNTQNFVVSFDNTLGANGQNLADAVLATCERDYANLQRVFGGITPAGLPFTVFIDPGSFGAFHASCAATELHCAAFSGTNADLERMLLVAEVDEVFMAAQSAGWDCGASNGEGLSRVLATVPYPAELNGFASGRSWLDSNRPDWATNTEPTDRNYVSIGCATLFINYLRHQLEFSLDKIVQKGAPTLEQTYKNLTGFSGAFAPFANLLQQRFPAGTPSGLTNDDPFPFGQELQVCGETDDGGVWHTIRHADGSWQPQFGDIKAQSGNPGHFVAVSCAGVNGELQVCGETDDGGMWHTIRHADGSWQPQFGDVKGQSGNAGFFVTGGCAGVDGELQICGITDDGGMWHTIRHTDGSWQSEFGDVKGQSGNPGFFEAVSCAGIEGELHVCGITDDGGMWHTIRHTDGSWQAQFGDVKGQSGNPGHFEAVSCAAVAGELHVSGITNDGGMWHTIRHADGSWQNQFGDVKGQSGNPGHFAAVSCAGINGELQLCGETDAGGMFHTIRHSDGTWQPQFGDVKTQSGDPGHFSAVGAGA